ncbi:DeoR family transcriptional regulator [Defluviimonas sp. 20V17]|uniref:DNA-binding transcriptional regulator n=1 Tax=Allgaiera indica TaxID=765699 RepID=A0AAN4UTF4_9RHOB|nr:sugar-binding transcriptional regulator [Allgaiera indica]KDB05627.1 DeoR family transcriptional regulator [Defluviimonas sp. 20V17]GHE04375.1 DNA-binding transcriptional regulator [Allgaiera indica]SDX40749.1 DNA-binding transcriptional regulator LsrR, DeoR family [Allgaiera indica]
MNRKPAFDAEDSATDAAARAGWLYYVGRLTQDQIAAELGVSRQRAQRLVSKAMSEGLIHVRLEHRIARCLALEAALKQRHGLRMVRVAPSPGPGADPTHGLAPVAAEVMERFLRQPDPLIIALGTGRALRATVEELPKMTCEQHKLVSLVGNIAPDGTASNYDVIMRMADTVRAPHYPMPLPVIIDDEEIRRMFYSLPQLKIVARLADQADVTFVGVGHMSESAPIYVDGFISDRDLREQRALGAVGEIVTSCFDAEGRYIEEGLARRVGGLRAGGKPCGEVIGIAAGPDKVVPLRAALKGGLLNGLVTGEDTAEALLESPE